MPENMDCFLCGTQAQAGANGFAITVMCPGCGRYVIDVRCAQMLKTSDPSDAGGTDMKVRASWRVRQATDAGEELELTVLNFDQVADFDTLPVSRRLFRFLELIALGSEGPGDLIPFQTPEFRARLRCRTANEVEFLFHQLVGRGMLTKQPFVEATGMPTGVTALTAKGWEAIEPAAGLGLPGICFVAMSFSPELNAAFDDGIRPAVEIDCGLKAVRVDRDEHNDAITDRILAGIRSAQVVIAEFTGQRQGVYFEAGFALGLGRTVIWTCKDDDFDALHFDTRQYNHIKWTAPTDLRLKLAARLKATATLPVRLR